MVDMLVRCGAAKKTEFVFCNTGLEYQATLSHLDDLEAKYGISIVKVNACKSIPTCVHEYGVPFWSKFASDMIERLQRHNFQWENKPFDELIRQYPNCRSALKWWCNISEGRTTQYVIKRAPFLKEFMIEHPPQMKISNRCCTYAKKKALNNYLAKGNFDMQCIGVRQAENGVRAGVYKSCFTEKSGRQGNLIDQFRPVFWLRDTDKAEYCKHYGITHSKCYTEYGLPRTGCFGCPFAKEFETELNIIKQYEPALYKAATNIFADSYNYTRQYLQYRLEAKNKK